MDLPRPVYLRPAVLVLVLLGGTVGTAVRAWVSDAFTPAAGGWPWATFVVNVGGSFLLGLVLTSLGRSRWEPGRRERVWLALGTGGLGGLTTYSTFAVEVVQLLAGGHAATGLGYGALSVAAGILAAAAGYRVGAR